MEVPNCAVTDQQNSIATEVPVLTLKRVSQMLETTKKVDQTFTVVFWGNKLVNKASFRRDQAKTAYIPQHKKSLFHVE